ncbi:MAG TPA: hydrogenase maturation protease [Thermoanaerobaculaceae bacterium]|nr:hydrogenase maturation protease [Thermoanaerobaculaceae bacterium]
MTGGQRPARVLIVGFGNPLMADDGAGPEVVQRLLARGLPRGVRVEDGGADSLRLPGLWRGEAEVWLVDAVTGGGEPGSIVRLGHDEVLAVPQRHATAHALSLPEGLRWISLSYPEMAAVSYRFWGIVVGRLALESGLSDAVVAAVGRVVSEILRELGH